jgi:hypothetical protein
MPSAQDCAEQLREQTYKTLLPQIRDLEEELQKVGSAVSTGVNQIEQKLDALRHIELPTTESVLSEILEDAVRQKDLEASTLILFARDLRHRETQEEILTSLLDSARDYFPHVAIFAVRGDRYVGWSSRGYPEALAGDIRSCSFLRSECPRFEEALESEVPVTAPDLPDNDPLPSLQKVSQGSWQLLPLRVMQRPVALVVAGGVEEIASRLDALAILAEFAALRLENIGLKILYELSAKPESKRKPRSAVLAAVTAAPAPPATPELSPLPALEEIPEKVQETEVYSQADLSPEPEPIQEPESPVEPVSATTEEQEFTAPAAEQVETPIPVPQPEVVEEPQAPPPVPDEERLHADAKRFARLLVSEIKLYNEHHIAEGRENRDLYLRLKRDIDKSREMYEKRVSPTVSRKIDYFHDEIIRILGDSDASLLGSDYPGPRVES